jgi:hypothetical protein
MRIARFAVLTMFAMTLNLFVLTNPAGATTGAWNCNALTNYIGQTNTTRGRTYTTTGGCGTMGVRLAYRTYAGSPTYLTGWTYDAVDAYRSTTNIMVYGQHTGSDCAWAYNCDHILYP